MSFFYNSGREHNIKNAYRPTIVITFEPSDDGSMVRVDKDLSTVLEPLNALNYTDFEIQNLLRSGVSLKSLQISKDLRIGFDSEIDAFSERLESIADKLYISKDE